MKKYRVLTIVLVFMSSLYGMQESNYDSLKNLFLSKFNRWVAEKYYSQYDPQLHEDAREEYQKLGKQAYEQLDIPQNEQQQTKQ